MRTKVTLILILLNVALFFFIFGFERQWHTDELARDARRRVLGSEAANIQSLEIRGDNLTTPIRLERQGETWQITLPYQWPANPFAVGRMVEELQFLEDETSFPTADLLNTGRSLADYGLENPALFVTFSSNPDAADPITLAIGKKTDIGNRLYVLSPDGDRVHVVSRSLAESLALGLDQIRADACFSIPVFEIGSLNLQNAGPANVRIRLRREGNRWRFESPIVTRASTLNTKATLNGLIDLKAHTFLGSSAGQPELLARAGTTTPTLRITIEGTNRRETLLLGAEVGPTAVAGPPTLGSPTATQPDREYYAQMESRDAVFTVVIPDKLATTLRSAQEKLRDPLVLDLEAAQIDALTLSDEDGREVVLQRLDGTAAQPISWQVVQRFPSGEVRTQAADPAIVEDQLLQRLRQLTALNFERDVPTDAELETWGLLQPRRRILLSLTSDSGAPLNVPSLNLLIGTNQDGSRAFAKLQHQTFVYAVDQALIAQIPVDSLYYRKRLLRELPAGARLTGLTVRDLQNNTVFYAHDLTGGETWDTVFAKSAPAERDALTALRNELRTLRAKTFVTDRFTDLVNVSGVERAWRFRIDAKLSLTGDTTAQIVDSTLFVAERDGGDRQLVGSPEFNVVFAAQQAFVDALWTLSYQTRDPGPIKLTPVPAGLPEESIEDEPAGATP
jgi:hypothetical protein